MRIDGLPEGVEIVAYREIRLDEFAVRDGAITRSVCGPQLIVQPAKGYKFVWDGSYNAFLPEKQLLKPRIVTIVFKVETMDQYKRLINTFQLKPGVERILESDTE